MIVFFSQNINGIITSDHQAVSDGSKTDDGCTMKMIMGLFLVFGFELHVLVDCGTLPFEEL